MKPFSCSECGRSYGSEASFHLHKRAWECKGEIVVHSAFICHICGKGLKDRMAEMKHLKQVHGISARKPRLRLKQRAKRGPKR